MKRGRSFWWSALVGWMVMAGAAVGALDAADRTEPAALVVWLVGGLVVHDLVWLPLTALVGTRLLRRVPPTVRLPLGWALSMTVVGSVVGWPFVRGYGRDPANPSLLPRDYGHGLVLLLAAVWVVTAVWVAVRRRSRASVPHPHSSAKS